MHHRMTHLGQGVADRRGGERFIFCQQDPEARFALDHFASPSWPAGVSSQAGQPDVQVGSILKR
jgi:hypothetical protein